MPRGLFHAAGRTACGPFRAVDEDRYAIARLGDDAGVFVVADGAGGCHGGGPAAEVAVRAIVDVYTALPPERRLDSEAMTEAARAANRAIQAHNEAFHGATGMCTIVIAVFVGLRCRVGWAGDCRAYRLHDDTLRRLTTDHSLVEELVRQGRLRPDEVANHRHAHIVLRGIGMGELQEPFESRLEDFVVGDRLLLATDGLWRTLDEAALREQLHGDDAADALVGAAVAAGTKDNAGALVVFVARPAAPRHLPPMLDREAPVLARLEALGIPYTLHRHAPVYTVEEARAARGDDDAVHVKNLFLRDKRETMWLLTVPEDRPLDLRALREVLGARGNPSFGSAERLRTWLGVEPGSVTPLAVLNDRALVVDLWLDEALRAAPRVGVHPNHNAATVILSGADLVRFVESTGHTPRWLAP